MFYMKETMKSEINDNNNNSNNNNNNNSNNNYYYITILFPLWISLHLFNHLIKSAVPVLRKSADK